ncbi:MAG: hypothetical protein ACREON_18825 [Gemmatimonadaceae bacterium]
MDRHEARERDVNERELDERIEQERVRDVVNDDARTEEPPTGEMRAEIPADRTPVTEAIGGVGGALAGASIGAIGGPVGAVIGAVAGALGGWWAGKSAADAEADFMVNEERYRVRYDMAENRPTDRSYDDVRHAYLVGHAASLNPDYEGRDFEDVEPELSRGWSDDLRSRYGDWSAVRGHVHEAYTLQRDREPNKGTARAVRGVERVRDRLSSGRSGLTSDDTVGY